MSLKLNSSGGGSVTLQEPTTANNQTLTLPDNSGTLVSTASTFAGTGPAFSVARAIGSSQTITSATFTKVQLTTEDFDTANAFDNTTNYRFTPQVAGYYQINATMTAVSSASLTREILAIYKNGAQYSRGVDIALSATANVVVYLSYSDLIYLNGSTDYLELYVYLVGTGTITLTAPGAGEATRMSGSMVRSA